MADASVLDQEDYDYSLTQSVITFWWSKSKCVCGRVGVCRWLLPSDGPGIIYYCRTLICGIANGSRSVVEFGVP